MSQSPQYKYFVCDAGPHLVIPSSIKASWTGMGKTKDPTDVNADYYRACEVEPPAGLIPVANESALVIGGNPRITACQDGDERGALKLFVIDRLTKPAPEQLIDEALRFGPKSTDTGLRWRLRTKGLALLFAGDQPDNAVYGVVHLDIPKGDYHILKSWYEGQSGSLWMLEVGS